MLYNKDLVVWHHRRVNIFQHLQQLKNYSIHRGFFIKKFKKNSLKVKYFILFFICFINISFRTKFINFQNNFYYKFIKPTNNYIFNLLSFNFLKTFKDGVFTSFSLIITTFFSQIVYGVFF